MKRHKTPNQTRQGATESEAASHFGVSKTTIQKWKSKGWAVLFKDKSIDLDSTATKVNANKDSRGGKPDRLAQPHDSYPTGDADQDKQEGAEGGSDPPTLIEARTRKERALATKAELEVRRLKGELIPVEDARRAFVEVIGNAKAALEQLPRRLSDRLVGLTDSHEVRRILTDEIATALRGLSKVPDVG